MLNFRTHGLLALVLMFAAMVGNAQYTLTVEATPAVTPGLTNYRFYVDMEDPTDRLSAVYGNNNANLIIHTPAGAFNSPFNSSWNASGINPAFLPVFPDLADDTYATIGLTGPASTSGLAGAADPSIVEDAQQPVTPYFLTPGATNLESTTLTGASWYVLNTASNGLPDADLRVLVMQVSTAGSISGQINAQVFPLGVGVNQYQGSTPFDGPGTYPLTCIGGACLPILGCTDAAACNYNPNANVDDGSCEALDECGVCGGEGIEDGACDCAGNVNDAIGVCGGDCSADGDGDGICDDEDECVGMLDACGVCNGPGAIYQCGCEPIPAGDCDCNGTQLDALFECGGDCAADDDFDGICDDIDDCVGAYDECGVCNGNGIPEGLCDCNGNVLDECGVCGGDGIPEGECDCDGNVLDACGVCGGNSVPGCTDPEACNYSALADCDLNCQYSGCPEFGCTDENACNYDAEADFEDGSCEYASCGGCNVEFACNYDPEAVFNDGSCDFLTCLVFGCSDELACNFDPEAQFNDGSCDYANFPYDCDGNCQSDVDGDGICDTLEIGGCVDPMACNYASGATDDDGSCTYGCAGCTNALACNYQPGATVDDGSCDFVSCNGLGCNDDGACNYDETAAINDGSCTYPAPGTCDCEGNVVDAIGVCGGTCATDNNGNGVCDEDDVLGCTDESALNYEVEATVDDGTCLSFSDVPDTLNYVATPNSGLLLGTILLDDVAVGEPAALAAFSSTGACVGWNILIEEGGQTYAALAIYGDDGTSAEVDGLLANEAFSLGLYLLASDTLLPYISPTGQTQITGWLNSFGAPLPDYSDASVEFAFYLDTQCNDAEACNYAPGSDSDDDCILPEAGYDCTGACVSDQDGDGVCDEFEILGCTDAAACNYDAEATEDDGSCLELDECGVCGGDGIAEGACDCDGNTEDALGICGGDCEADLDNDGVCDDIDECVGDFDACGVCNGPGEVYACGCNDIPARDCDCDGNQLDALGMCGGDCLADVDADGICDDVDDCVGELDACGVCNGPGDIYECG